MRWSLLRIAEDAHRFVWSSHHLLLDGWSTQLVVKEVFALYDAFLGGEEPRLERVVPYGEYIGWLRAQSQAPAEAFWRARLHGFSAPTSLGVDRPVGPGAGERYGELRFELSESDSGLLAAFARKHKLTVSTLVQGPGPSCSRATRARTMWSLDRPSQAAPPRSRGSRGWSASSSTLCRCA